MDDDFNERVKHKFAELERRLGRVPQITELAQELGVDSRMLARKLRKAIATMGIDAFTEGTSAFKSTLRKMLSGGILIKGRPGQMELFALIEHAKRSVKHYSYLDWGDGQQKYSLMVNPSEGGHLWFLYKNGDKKFIRVCDDVSVVSDLIDAVLNGENVDSELITHMDGEPKLYVAPIQPYQDPIPADRLPPNVLPFTKPYQHSED